MAHGSQALFFYWVKDNYPQFFSDQKVLDVGSLNINGCNKIMFSGCDYTGLDIGEGENVDLVCIAHEHDAPDGHYDVIVSSECFEHDMHIEKTLKNIVRMLKPGGLFAFTCAANNRNEHGTRSTDPDASPFTSKIDGWCDYYRGLSIDDMQLMIDLNEFDRFSAQEIQEDLHFFGIKKSDVRHDPPKQTFEEFAQNNAVSRLVKTPYYVVCGEVDGEEQWFVAMGDLLYPIAMAYLETGIDPNDVKIKHQGEMLLKEDLGCMNTKTE